MPLCNGPPFTETERQEEGGGRKREMWHTVEKCRIKEGEGDGEEK